MGAQEFIKGKDAAQVIINGISSMTGGFFIFRADKTEELIYANTALLALAGCENGRQFLDFTGGTISGLIVKRDYEFVKKNIKDQITASPNRFDHVCFRIRTAAGKTEYVESYGRLVEDEVEGPIYQVFIVDARMRYSAFDNDELTGLPGRRCFLENVSRKIEVNRNSAEPVQHAFAYINLTEFKALNVRMGVTEGDTVLRTFADILLEIFPENCISRFSDDHFVVCTVANGLIKKLECLNDRFIDKNINDIVGLKIGIYYLSDNDVSPAVACDLAKYASDFIKNDERSFYCVYYPGMEQKSELENYLIRNLDKALNMGHIKVFYQPVIRTLTGSLCGKEALCRWLDPERGFISPTVFIPALEKSKIIHKLDNFIVKQVCRDLHEELKTDGFAVPVSFNLSRLDFSLGSPFEEVEKAARKYDIPREYLRVEITETTLMENPDRIRLEIDKFHSAGYQVWMDDFGSGFSSLNVLKDFDFDEIKVDMLFLSNFNDRSKSIIRHTIMMAKDLGIKTLAEGVETEEQYNFLKDIGCQKIQGSFFGRAMSAQDIRKNIQNRNIKVETAEERRYFTQVGRVNVITDNALALVEDDGKEFHFYFINDAYRKALGSMGTMSVEQAEANLNDRGTAMGQMYRNYALQVEMAGAETVFVYMDRGQSMRLVASPIATSREKYMLKLELENLRFNDTAEKQHAIDTYIRSMMYIFDSADILHIDEDYVEEFMRWGSFANFGTRLNGLEGLRNFFSDRIIYGDDYERYYAFSDPNTLADRIRKSGRGYIRDDFRLKNLEGNYEWKTIWELLFPNSDKTVIIQLVQDSHKYYEQAESNYPDKIAAYWDALMKNSEHCFFWKDRDNRYLGANKAFMDYHDVKSLDEIVGRKDEEIGWHMNVVQSSYGIKALNEIVKTDGYKNMHLMSTKDGVSKRTIASKYPVYEHENFVGYLGIFDDENPEALSSGTTSNENEMDPVTGLMNASAAYDTELKIYDNFHQRKSDFAFIELEVAKFETIFKSSSKETKNKLLRLVADKIRSNISRSEKAARVIGSRFVIISDTSDHDYVLKMIQDIISDIQGINVLDDMEFRLVVNAGVAFASEAQDIEKLNNIVQKRRLEYAEKHEEKFAVDNNKNGIEPGNEVQLYHSIPVAVAAFRLILDESNSKVVDAEFLYANERYCKAVHRQSDELIGKNFSSVIKGADSSWAPYCYRALMEKRDVHGRIFTRETGHWTEFTISPINRPGCIAITLMSSDNDRASQDTINKDVTTDDRIIRVARLLVSNEPYNDMMNRVLEELSHMIHPERLYILEQDEKYISNAFEWCADGIEPEIDLLQKLDRDTYSGWENMLNYDTCIFIPDIEGIRDEDRVLYDLLKQQYIKRLIAVPLYDNGKLIGYLGADNYEISQVLDTRRLLETVSAFIASKIASHQMLSRLHYMSHYDALTGVHNRNAIFVREKELSKDNRPAGIIYVDMNGLKQANDAKGHEEGDKRLKEAAKVLSDTFGFKNVYRIGGDEFVVILADIHEKEFEREKKRLYGILKDNPELKLSKGFQWCEGTQSINDAIRSADKKMYEDKRSYYIDHDRRKGVNI